jgi:hypothetical protein
VEHALGISGPVTLAKCRRSGTVSLLPLDKLASRAEAEAFQAAAVNALDRGLNPPAPVIYLGVPALAWRPTPYDQSF